MSIPKIIHYCWFGPKEIPALERHCMLSWEKYFPDYKIMFWNEETFDISSNQFAQQAYDGRYYAFVSDYVRTKVLYDYGGIYLDTDVDVLSDFAVVLKKERSFLGFETRAKLGTAVMGFTAKHPIMEIFLEYYHANNFKDDAGNVNTIANVTILTDILSKRGLGVDGTLQLITDIDIYPREYFYPKKLSEAEFRITDQTIAIHKCANSWMTERERTRGNNELWINIMRPLLRFFRRLGLFVMGESGIQKIEIKLRNLLK